MTRIPQPYGEPSGSSAKTAIAVGIGAAVGATALVAMAPVILPVVGLGALVAIISPTAGAVIGGWAGWMFGGSK